MGNAKTNRLKILKVHKAVSLHFAYIFNKTHFKDVSDAIMYLKIISSKKPFKK